MFSKKLKFNSNSGFTLVELLAVIAIIGIMSAVAIVNYASTRNKSVRDKAVQQLIADLRRVQNMAMSTATINGNVPAGGYGIHFDPATPSYVIFADNVPVDHMYGAGDTMISNGVFDSGVQISTLSFTNITFVPPNPNVFIDGAQNVISATITIRYPGVTPDKVIGINGVTGQITAN